MPTPSPAGPKQHNWLLVAGVIALALFPVLFVRGEYAGSDGQGTEAIQKLQPGYKPWFEPVVELPSGEIESLMFATQAALGAGEDERGEGVGAIRRGRPRSRVREGSVGAE